MTVGLNADPSSPSTLDSRNLAACYFSRKRCLFRAAFSLRLLLLPWNRWVVGRRVLLRVGVACHGSGSRHRHM